MADFTISLKAARINAELTRVEAAEKIGVSEGAITGWEQGKHKIPYESVVMLAEVYKCPVGFIRVPDSSQ